MFRDSGRLDRGEIPSPEIADSLEYINVTTNTFGVTRFDHPNPILRTDSWGTCAVLALYNDARVAGLIHISPNKPHLIKTGIARMILIMIKNGADNDRSLFSYGLLPSFKNYNTVDRHILDYMKELRVVRQITHNIREAACAFDSRDGQLYDLRDLIPRPTLEVHFAQAVQGWAYGLQLTADPRSLG